MIIEFSSIAIPLFVVYPSLESDEDDPALKSLPKKKKSTDDAPWSPKGKKFTGHSDGTLDGIPSVPWACFILKAHVWPL